MRAYPWPTDEGWPYPDAQAEEADQTGEVDDDLLSVRVGRPHLFDGLTPLEREVVASRFGLDGAPARSMRELRDSLGLPRSDVRDALGSGLAKLRTSLSG